MEDWENGDEGEVEIGRLRKGGRDDKTFETGSSEGKVEKVGKATRWTATRNIEARKMGTSGPSTRGKCEVKGAERAERIRSRKTRKADGRVGCMRQECPRASPELVSNNCEVVFGERSTTMNRN